MNLDVYISSMFIDIYRYSGSKLGRTLSSGHKLVVFLQLNKSRKQKVLSDSMDKMDFFRCAADCREEAFVHCLLENKCYCSMHFKKAHVKHQFKAISKEELAKRKQIQAILVNDLRAISPEGLSQVLAESIRQSVLQAAESFRITFEEWIAGYRDQLMSLKQALEDSQAKTWQSAVERVIERLAEDYSGPLLEYELTITPLQVRFNPASPAVSSPEQSRPEEEAKEESLIHRFRALSSNIPSYFQTNQDSISPELRKAWAAQNFHQLVIKGLTSDADLVGIALLLAHSKLTKVLVVTRCGYKPRTADLLKEAFELTISELKTVDISGNELGDEGFRVVIEGVTKLSALTLLAIRNTGLTDTSIPLLTRLKGVKLDATGNQFSIEGKTALLTHNPDHKL